MKKITLFLIFLLFIPVINTLSQTSMNTKLVGHWGTYGNSYCVATGLIYLYIGSGPMFVVLDVSDPLHLVETGALRLPYEPREIAVSGNYACVVDGYSGLRIININDSSNPVETGFLNFIDFTSDVYIKGNYAYVTSYGGGLHIIDISDPSSPVEIGKCLVPGLAMGVAVSGDYAYVAANWEGLRIIDISDPEAPVEVGHNPLSGYAMGLAVANDFAYVADWENKLRVVDVRDPSDPVEIAVNRTNGNPNSVFVRGNNVFVADGNAGLHIMDISNPYELTSGFTDTPGNAVGLIVTGSYAYVADEDYGLRIIDVSDPATLYEVGHMDTPGYSSFILTRDNYAYIADSTAGLRIVDITTPSNLTEIGSYDTPGEALELAFYEDYVIIADGSSGFRIIDVSVPSSPVEISCINTIGSVRLVEIQGDYAYVTSDTNLYAIDIIDPQYPVITGTVGISSITEIEGMAVNGHYAYLCARRYSWSRYFYVIDIQSPSNLSVISELYIYGNQSFDDIILVGDFPYIFTSYGARVIDVSDPASPFEKTLLSNFKGTSAAFQGNYAYTCDGDLRIYDFADPLYPDEIGYFNTAGEVNHISAIGDKVFVADGDCGVCAIDVSDPVGPEEIGNYYHPGRFSKLELYKNYIIAGDYDEGLSIIDVSDNGNLQKISSLSINRFYDLAIKEDKAYVVGQNDFRIVDLSNPFSPYSITGSSIRGREIDLNGYYALVRYDDLRIVEIKDENLMNAGTYPGYFNCMATEGRMAYTSDDAGLNFIDISNPYSPFLIASEDSVCAGSMVVINEILYLAGQDSIFRIMDVSNPEDPVIIGHCELPSVPAEIHIEENLAFLACGRSGLRILDISNPAQPFEAGYYLTPGDALGLDVNGNQVYVADQQAGLLIIRHDLMTSINHPQGKLAPVLLNCYPNPLNKQATVSFTLPEASEIRIEVMNCMGNVMAVLLDEYLPKGEHRINWNSDGLPAGLYICRLIQKASKISVTRKMIKSGTE